MNIKQRQFHVQNVRNIVPSSIRSTTRLNIGLQQSHHPFSYSELRDQEQLRKLDIGIAYQQLRQTALGANYRQVQVFIKILVEERGEKPTLRLYDALLLANADHEYGSVPETARLLEETANEGLTPDSATYHAVLRVSVQGIIVSWFAQAKTS